MVTAVGAVDILAALLMAYHRSPCILLPGQYRDAFGQRLHPSNPRGGRCRIRIFLPEEEQDAPVVICSELPNNPGGSITNPAEVIAVDMIRSHKLPSSLVWIEHWPEESTDGGEETFDLVVFSSYEVTERVLYLGEGRAWLGDATWKRLDRATVEVLVGGKV